MVLAADGRRQTQTFSPADLTEENRLALRAGEMIRARGSAGELRLVPHREAIASFSSAGRGVKNQCSRMRKHSAAVCASLRVSAAKKLAFKSRQPAFAESYGGHEMPLPQMG